MYIPSDVPGVWMISNEESQARHDAKPYDAASDSEDDDADEEAGRSYDGEMEPTVRRGDVNTPSVVDSGNWPYHKFLKFIRSGCNGSPLEGYPIVVLALSTIPVAVSLSPLHEPIGQRSDVGVTVRL